MICMQSTCFHNCTMKFLSPCPFIAEWCMYVCMTYRWQVSLVSCTNKMQYSWNGNQWKITTLWLCVFSLPISLVMIEIIYTLSYHHYQIGSMNYHPLFRVRSWNNGMRCMSLYILMDSDGGHFEDFIHIKEAQQIEMDLVIRRTGITRYCLKQNTDTCRKHIMLWTHSRQASHSSPARARYGISCIF